MLSCTVYDPYGTEHVAYGSPSDPFGYNARSGYYMDREDGLYLCQHRFYDPAQSRWLNRDPIGYDGGTNLYGYCGDGPVMRGDRSGRQVEEAEEEEIAIVMAESEVAAVEAYLQDDVVIAEIKNSIQPAGPGDVVPDAYYPPKNGFVFQVQYRVEPGDLLDRYGDPEEGGRFMGQHGTDPGMLSLPPDKLGLEPIVLECEKQFEVTGGPALPWYPGQPGLGWQMMTDPLIQDLIDSGFLKRLPSPGVPGGDGMFGPHEL